MDTIFALSSGAPPAAIAIIRISGPCARAALTMLGTGKDIEPRKMHFTEIRDPADATLLDRGLVVWLPGPGTATGEDCAELHLHGGRAVVSSVAAVLGRMPGLRGAQPGEFTRRAFLNGRIDLAEAEGLADLLAAETELQRRSAMAMASGTLSRAVESWREALLGLSAAVEAELDFADEEDVTTDLSRLLPRQAGELAASIGDWLDNPSAEVLRDGFHVVLAGPPNTGKSTLFNALIGQEAAITDATPGTTRDLVERSVAIEGIPFRFTDTAGLRAAQDPVEAIGIARAHAAVEDASLVLWLGSSADALDGMLDVASRTDIAGSNHKPAAQIRVSAVTGEGMETLRDHLLARARDALAPTPMAALNHRQRGLLSCASRSLLSAAEEEDPILVAEQLRQTRLMFDQLTGRSDVEAVLDGLFGRFCVGK